MSRRAKSSSACYIEVSRKIRELVSVRFGKTIKMSSESHVSVRLRDSIVANTDTPAEKAGAISNADAKVVCRAAKSIACEMYTRRLEYSADDGQ